jgi:hypothetical protein
METRVFSDYGIEIFKRGDSLYVCCDSGELVGRLLECKISEHEAERLKRGVLEAEQVLLSLVDRLRERS